VRGEHVVPAARHDRGRLEQRLGALIVGREHHAAVLLDERGQIEVVLLLDLQQLVDAGERLI
jgi:hypothetical protein